MCLDWSLLAQWVQTVAVILGIWLALRQIREGVQVRRQQAFRDVVRELGSEGVREVRARVQRMRPVETLTREELLDAQTVAVTLDREAYLIHHCCPGDEFWIPANRLIGRELGVVSVFPDLNFFWADLAQNRPSGSGIHHRQ